MESNDRLQRWVPKPAMSTRIADPKAGTDTVPRLSNALLLTGAQLSRGLVRLLFVFVVARLLGPNQFGVYALLLALVEMLAVASGSGYADYLTREAAKDPRVGWGLGSQLIWLRLSCLAPLVGAGAGILWALHYSKSVVIAAIWLSLSLAPRSISEAVQGVLRGIDRCIAYAVVEWSFDLALLGGVVLLFVGGGSLNRIIVVEVLAATAAAVASLVFLFWFRSSERIGLSARELLKKSAIFNIYTFVGNLYDRLDIVLVSKMAGNYATGVYSAAYRPISMLQLVPYGVLYSLLPALSRNGTDSETRGRLEKAMGLLLSVSFATVLATMVLAGPAVRLLLGQSYAESAVALKILIWAIILRYLNYALSVQLLAACQERVFVVTSLICLGVNVIGNFIFIPIYSWRAAAALTIATELVLLAQNVFWLRRMIGTVPKPFGGVRTSMVFASLLLLSLMGERVASPVYVGSAAVLLFLLYLYRSGMVREFAASWSFIAGTGLEGHNS